MSSTSQPVTGSIAPAAAPSSSVLGAATAVRTVVVFGADAAGRGTGFSFRRVVRGAATVRARASASQ
uniref:Uncharacterized protein n=1 Tax=Conchiformibius kuhniae TaxID=211502 RepID=A0A8T9MU02_9NEIS|nr:hypothetical protein LVJ77_01990 [Conchiformibius kuhniae]